VATDRPADARLLAIPSAGRSAASYTTTWDTTHLDPEGELLDHVVDEVDGVGLIVPVVDFQGPDACGVVDGGVLVTLDRSAIFAFERQELDVDLDVVPWDPFLIPGCVDRPATDLAGKPIHLPQAVDGLKKMGAVSSDRLHVRLRPMVYKTRIDAVSLFSETNAC